MVNKDSVLEEAMDNLREAARHMHASEAVYRTRARSIRVRISRKWEAISGRVTCRKQTSPIFGWGRK
jgi:hypothetical protein